MSDEPKWITFFQKFKEFANKNVIPKVKKLTLRDIGKGSIGIIVTLSAIKVFAIDIHQGYNMALEKIRENAETNARRNMIGTDVAHGLAWSHYFGFLQYVLPDLEKKIDDSKWFKEFEKEVQPTVKASMPMKLYQLIPRTCHVDIHGGYNNIKRIGYITVVLYRCGNKRTVDVPIYSITDVENANKEYYFLSDCPNVLKTINTVNDIQTAGICTKSNFSFPWSKKLTWQQFTVDSKLVQLMRFYYAMTALLCLKNETKDNARLVLINESKENPSKVLLRLIKEDLKKKTEKEDNLKKTEEEKKKEKEIEDLKKKKEKEEKEKGKEKEIEIEKVPKRSLMEKTLLSAEENQDIKYEFDAFVAQSSLDRNDRKAVEDISQSLKEKKGMNILFEKDCLGQDWLETLKFAATKCRWIVLLEEKKCSPTNETSWFEKIKSKFLKNKGSETKTLMSSKVVASLKNILESRKVQTVAVVNERDELHINDDLRWVTCISYNDNDEQLVDTLCKVMTGSEVKLNSSKDLYLKPGEAAVGLALGYAVNYLNNALPKLKAETKEILAEKKDGFKLKAKLFLVVPESCVTHKHLADFKPVKDTENETELQRSFQFSLYKLNKNKETYFFGQYPPPVEVIYKMKQEGLITDEQMKSEVKKFCTTVEQIMEILLKGKQLDFEFVYHNDTNENETLSDVMSKRIE